MKICKYELPIIQYFDLPTQIAVQNSSAVSGIDRVLFRPTIRHTLYCCISDLPLTFRLKILSKKCMFVLRVVLVKISYYFYLYCIRRLLSGAFAKLPKAIIGFVISFRPSVRPSVRIEQLCSHWTDFLEI
jgi:hypothetical protein